MYLTAFAHAVATQHAFRPVARIRKTRSHHVEHKLIPASSGLLHAVAVGRGTIERRARRATLPKILLMGASGTGQSFILRFRSKNRP